jgi:hypothetical protein
MSVKAQGDSVASGEEIAGFVAGVIRFNTAPRL